MSYLLTEHGKFGKIHTYLIDVFEGNVSIYETN